MMAKENAGERMTSLTDAMRDLLPASERHQIPPATQKEREREERLLSETRRGLAEDRRVERTFRGMFWNDEESDPEMLTRDGPEDEFVGDDISSMAHGKLEEIRERRHYARIAAWEMPLLSSEFSCGDLLLFRSHSNGLQNSPNPLSRQPLTCRSASGSHPTWASSTPPRRRSWSSSAPRTWA